MELIMNVNSKKERLKLTLEQLFNLYLECNAPGAPVKSILERLGHGCHTQESQGRRHGSPCSSRKTGTEAAGYTRGTIPKSFQRA